MEESDDAVVVRRAGKFTSLDVYDALFGKQKAGRTPRGGVKEGIRKYIRGKHARR